MAIGAYGLNSLVAWCHIFESEHSACCSAFSRSGLGTVRRGHAQLLALQHLLNTGDTGQQEAPRIQAASKWAAAAHT